MHWQRHSVKCSRAVHLHSATRRSSAVTAHDEGGDSRGSCAHSSSSSSPTPDRTGRRPLRRGKGEVDSDGAQAQGRRVCDCSAPLRSSASASPAAPSPPPPPEPPPHQAWRCCRRERWGSPSAASPMWMAVWALPCAAVGDASDTSISTPGSGCTDSHVHLRSR